MGRFSRAMPFGLRWLLALFALFASATAAAHPMLEDSLGVTFDGCTVHLEARSTLRPIVVAAGAVPHDGAYFAPSEVEELVQTHLAYLQRHLSLRVNDQLVHPYQRHAEMAEPLAHPVQEHIDLERYHARFMLKFAAPCPIERISLEEDMLTDAPSDRTWRLSHIVSVRNAGRPTLLASGLLTPEHGFDYRLRPTTSAPPRDLWGFFLAGLRHILGGWDHLLFVSALVVATRRLAQLVQVVLAFTIAHSVTLTLAVLHLVHLPEAVVEPLIALSILVVSLTNLLRPERGAGVTRLAVAFGFGLVHGLGFAGPLVDALQGAPTRAIAIGIVGFSLGVELGHQLVVLPLFALIARQARRSQARSRTLTVRIASIATALGGAFFLVRALQTFVFA